MVLPLLKFAEGLIFYWPPARQKPVLERQAQSFPSCGDVIGLLFVLLPCMLCNAIFCFATL